MITTPASSPPTSSTASALHPLLIRIARFGGVASMLLAFVLIINNFLTYVGGLPGLYMTVYTTLGIGSAAQAPLSAPISNIMLVMGWGQVALVLAALAAAAYYTETPSRPTPSNLTPSGLMQDAEYMDRLASFIVRAAFWAVLLVGLTDALISFIRIEDIHTALFGTEIATKLGQSAWRGVYIHIPLMVLGLGLAMRDKSVSVVWLIVLVVIAEMLIVLARFIFSYEQTFMGDLVRFWYAALFLFASAYTLKQEGHVRVDVLFAGFSERKKAWVNATGALAFGMPLCWVILDLGLSSRTSLINSAVLNFETSMSGFGMYVKYLMAAFLLVFATSMLAQFTSSFFKALAIMNNETKNNETA